MESCVCGAAGLSVYCCLEWLDSMDYAFAWYDIWTMLDGKTRHEGPCFMVRHGMHA